MNKNFEQMLRLVDYVDGLMVVDKNCIIRHYYTAYPELVNLRQDEPLNRSLFEIYPSLKREDSYICRARERASSTTSRPISTTRGTPWRPTAAPSPLRSTARWWASSTWSSTRMPTSPSGG